MVIYTDKQITIALKELGRTASEAISMMAVLQQAAKTPNRRNQLLKNIIAEYDFYQSKEAITCLFDQYGSYAGQIIATSFDDEGKKLILSNPQYIRAATLWREGIPNWIVHWEAERGASRHLARAWREMAADLPTSISYIRPRGTSLVMKAWKFRPDRDASLKPQHVSQTTLLADVAHCFTDRVQPAREEVVIARLLAADEARVWTVQEGVAAINSARALKQIVLISDEETGRTGAVIWAWLSQQVLETLKDKAHVHLRPAEWNCGRIPCVIASIGDRETTSRAQQQLIAGMPKGAEPACRLIIDSAGKVQGYEEL